MADFVEKTPTKTGKDRPEMSLIEHLAEALTNGHFPAVCAKSL